MNLLKRKKKANWKHSENVSVCGPERGVQNKKNQSVLSNKMARWKKLVSHVELEGGWGWGGGEMGVQLFRPWPWPGTLWKEKKQQIIQMHCDSYLSNIQKYQITLTALEKINEKIPLSQFQWHTGRVIVQVPAMILQPLGELFRKPFSNNVG